MGGAEQLLLDQVLRDQRRTLGNIRHFGPPPKRCPECNRYLSDDDGICGYCDCKYCGVYYFVACVTVAAIVLGVALLISQT